MKKKKLQTIMIFKVLMRLLAVLTILNLHPSAKVKVSPLLAIQHFIIINIHIHLHACSLCVTVCLKEKERKQCPMNLAPKGSSTPLTVAFVPLPATSIFTQNQLIN